MNRHSILAISAMTALGLALVPSGAVAQQRTLKGQLVGTWTLVSSEYTLSNGTKRQQYGANPKGILMFDAGGRYAAVTGRANRPKTPNRFEVTTEEMGKAALEYGANFGTWSVNEADKTLTRRFEAALIPNNEGTDLIASVSLAGDELKISGVVQASGTKIESVYRRAR